MKKILVLENIRSVHNVGAIFRTADAIGIDEIILVGYTPAPVDRFGRAREDLHKAALGAEQSVAWRQINEDRLVDFLNELRATGFKIIALEQAENSVDYKSIEVSGDVVIVVGNEVTGVSKEVLEISDSIAEIEMAGKKESLNVSVATGILLFGLFDKAGV